MTSDGFGAWPSADDHATVGGPVRTDGGGGFGYTEADLDAALEALAPATRERIRLVLADDETLREWVREAAGREDLPVVPDDPVEAIVAAVWHRFATDVDPGLERRVSVAVDLDAELWAHIQARARARYQRRGEREGPWSDERSPETILADIVNEYVEFYPLLVVDGAVMDVGDVFDAAALAAEEGEEP